KNLSASGQLVVERRAQEYDLLAHQELSGMARASRRLHRPGNRCARCRVRRDWPPRRRPSFTLWTRSRPASSPASIDPGGNARGISLFTAALEPKKLELLHELVPKADVVIGALVNPRHGTSGRVGYRV